MVKELRVFISSPGDVPVHRNTVRQLVEGFSDDPLVTDHCRLSAVSWDRPGTAIPMSANHTCQWSISEHLPKPGDCDLTIVLFWSRIGTSLPRSIRRADGTLYPSGTVWELEHARDAGKPVWIYRKTAPLPDSADADATRRQHRKLDRYLGKARNPDGSINFGVHRFDDDAHLREQLSQHLRWFVRQQLAQSAVVNAPHAQLRPLHTYPTGPMVRDILITHLPEAIAELKFDDNPKVFFSQVNHRLATIRREDEPALRLSPATFARNVGGRFFWEDVLHAAALHGPRVLACVLSQFRPEEIDGPARAEFLMLIEKVNRYV